MKTSQPSAKSKGKVVLFREEGWVCNLTIRNTNEGPNC